MIDGVGLFLFLAGFVIGLGAVSVIDVLGFLGRTSRYWTEATVRAHKVTKPLIWLGITCAVLGGLITYHEESLVGIPLAHACIALVLIANGAFLSSYVSPILLAREQAGQADQILPRSLQRTILVSIVVSDVGWWSALVLLVVYLV